MSLVLFLDQTRRKIALEQVEMPSKSCTHAEREGAWHVHFGKTTCVERIDCLELISARIDRMLCKIPVGTSRTAPRIHLRGLCIAYRL
jgi:hypothetical protein